MKKCFVGSKVFIDGKLNNTNVWVENDIIVGITNELMPDAEIINKQDLICSPGFIDIHVHMRSPGFEHKEDFVSGGMSAAAGGFTQICAMPNTRPTVDNPEVLEQCITKADKESPIKIHFLAAITEKLNSEKVTDFTALKKSGAIAMSNDGLGVQTSGTMLEAMKLAKSLDLLIVAHCEDESLVNHGAVHEGILCQKHNIKGITSVSESVQIARDILLSEATDCKYHICHISTKESVRVVRDAKRAGLKVTAEVTPHHLLLTEDDVDINDANFKMNPPLRSKADRAALIEGLLDGTIDCIATDHAPHAVVEKQLGFEKAPFGILGLENAFNLLYNDLVLKGICTLEQLLGWLTIEPAKIFNLTGGEIKIGMPADLVFLDLNKNYTITDQFYSKSKNSPFIGKSGKGVINETYYKGNSVFVGK